MTSSKDLALKKDLSLEFEADPVISNLDKIQSGELAFTDDDFDNILPPYYQFCSAVQWTSFEVASVVSEWLQNSDGKKIIDVGCGLGKLCLYLRLTTRVNVHGIEQRKHLIEIANRIFKTNDISNINILHMNVLDLSWEDYDIFYFFNPFYENIISTDLFQIDKEVIFSKENFISYSTFVYEALEKLPSGKVIITYHGFGKCPPPTWRLIKSKVVRGGFLEWWEKQND